MFFKAAKIKFKFIGLSIRMRVKRLFQHAPDLYLALVAFGLGRRGWNAALVTSEKSVAAIEGYPRSGNSFAVKAFRSAQGECGKWMPIGNHTHAFPNLKRAARMEIPAVAIVRQPEAAIIGLACFTVQNLQVDPRHVPVWFLRELAIEYSCFYSKVDKAGRDIMVASFDEVTTDFGLVIEKINERFKQKFKIFCHNKENVKRIFSESPSHLSPSQERDRIKEIIRPKFESLKESNVIRKAEFVYSKCIDKAERNLLK